MVDALADKYGVTLKQLNQALFGLVHFNNKQIILAKPLTFMNLSGQAVSFLLAYFNLSPERLVVIHDDLDLPLATLRIKTKGSAGGHLGLVSIINALNSDKFYRLRIGIGRPPGRKDPAKFVLEPFSKKEEEQISITLEQAANAIIDFITEGAAYAMNKYNKRH